VSTPPSPPKGVMGYAMMPWMTGVAVIRVSLA
jgi:hypothetical protein